jgi:hypothetical protein
MPKPRKSRAAMVIEYFRGEDPKVARTVYELVREIIRERSPEPKTARAKKSKSGASEGSVHA